MAATFRLQGARDAHFIVIIRVVYSLHACLQRANDEGAAWAIPVRGDADPSIDPFEALSVDKKKRVVKNKLSMLRNMVCAALCAGSACAPTACLLCLAVRKGLLPAVPVDYKLPL